MNLFLLVLTSFVLLTSLPAADPVFSGPQPGEKATPFKVVDLTGAQVDQEREVMADKTERPMVLVFLHGIERSMMPLLRVVDEYGALQKDKLRTEVIFLSADRLQGAQRMKAAAGSLKLQSRVGLSLDGAEGPGNYGLNKECLLTIVIAQDAKVTANFALVQPGIADAPKVLEALAKACADPMPPTLEELNQRHNARNGAGRDGAGMARGNENAPRPAADLSKFDLNTNEGLRAAVQSLTAEVRSLRAELEAARGGAARPQRGEAPAGNPPPSKGPFPGAVPTDGPLQGMLRNFIRPSNDDATVDGVLAKVRDHIKNNADLKHQAIEGWTRILHFGETYGTEYARKAGRAFLEELKK